MDSDKTRRTRRIDSQGKTIPVEEVWSSIRYNTTSDTRSIVSRYAIKISK